MKLMVECISHIFLWMGDSYVEVAAIRVKFFKKDMWLKPSNESLVECWVGIPTVISLIMTFPTSLFTE